MFSPDFWRVCFAPLLARVERDYRWPLPPAMPVIVAITGSCSVTGGSV